MPAPSTIELALQSLASVSTDATRIGADTAHATKALAGEIQALTADRDDLAGKLTALAASDASKAQTIRDQQVLIGVLQAKIDKVETPPVVVTPEPTKPTERRKIDLTAIITPARLAANKNDCNAFEPVGSWSHQDAELDGGGLPITAYRFSAGDSVKLTNIVAKRVRDLIKASGRHMSITVEDVEVLEAIAEYGFYGENAGVSEGADSTVTMRRCKLRTSEHQHPWRCHGAFEATMEDVTVQDLVDAGGFKDLSAARIHCWRSTWTRCKFDGSVKAGADTDKDTANDFHRFIDTTFTKSLTVQTGFNELLLQGVTLPVLAIAYGVNKKLPHVTLRGVTIGKLAEGADRLLANATLEGRVVVGGKVLSQ